MTSPLETLTAYMDANTHVQDDDSADDVTWGELRALREEITRLRAVIKGSADRLAEHESVAAIIRVHMVIRELRQALEDQP